MKVKELIEQLQKLDPEATVICQQSDDYPNEASDCYGEKDRTIAFFMKDVHYDSVVWIA